MIGCTVQYLLPGEDVLVEVELDLLIGDVDAELLERVPLKVLKAEDVQDPDVQTLVVLSTEKFKDRVRTNVMLPVKKCVIYKNVLSAYL